MLETGLKHTSELTVSDAMTAKAVGSGDLPVLATPMMIALMENAAMLAVQAHLPEGNTTVGGHIKVSHVRPSNIGDAVQATAEVIAIKRKKVTYRVEAYCDGQLIGEGTHLRFIVERNRFLVSCGLQGTCQ